ncbi:Mss4-like protein [Stachybotrys elegans]|uniref:Mss4-like protein n=1 Tax=Stachybotrys elegans TaxID=80388 RepID=A0A8K0SB20_9HYPO|nr:Mss4-like protein [Stachybotrys elegans]
MAATDDWTLRPPYTPASDRDSFTVQLSASCHCGRVQYHLDADAPLDSKFCHCRGCQIIHVGASFQHAAIFSKASVAFTKESINNISFYSSSTRDNAYSLPCKLRCSFCGTLILDEGRNMVLLFPSLIRFDSPEARSKFQVNHHIFYGQRVVDIPDGKPKWEGLDHKSRRLDEP